MRQWKPWTRSTGPTTPEGMSRSARNAWKGGRRVLLRELSRIVSGEIHKTRKLVLRAAPTAEVRAIDGG